MNGIDRIDGTEKSLVAGFLLSRSSGYPVQFVSAQSRVHLWPVAAVLLNGGCINAFSGSGVVAADSAGAGGAGDTDGFDGAPGPTGAKAQMSLSIVWGMYAAAQTCSA